MSKRLTETEKWTDPWFRRLRSEWKLAWLYLLDNCDMAGVVDLDEELAEFQIGDAVDFQGFVAASDGRVEILENGKIFIPAFLSFQYGVLSLESRVHKSVITTLQKHGLEKHSSVEVVESSPTIGAKRKRLTNKAKQAIYELDNYTCQYCGLKLHPDDARADHVVPVTKGGSNEEENVVTACHPCNHKKNSQDVFEFIKRNQIRPLDRLSKILDTLSGTLDTPKEKVKDKVKDKNKEIELPTILDSPEFRSVLESWLDYHEPYKPRGLQSLISSAAKRAEQHGLAAVVNALEIAMSNGWKGWNFDGSFQPTRGKSTEVIPI